MEPAPVISSSLSGTEPKGGWQEHHFCSRSKTPTAKHCLRTGSVRYISKCQPLTIHSQQVCYWGFICKMTIVEKKTWQNNMVNPLRGKMELINVCETKKRITKGHVKTSQCKHRLVWSRQQDKASCRMSNITVRYIIIDNNQAKQHRKCKCSELWQINEFNMIQKYLFLRCTVFWLPPSVEPA